MTFPFNAYLLAVAGAFVASFLSLPLWRKWCQRTGLVDDPGHRKIHEQPTALAGGLAVFTGILIPLLVSVLVLWWMKAHEALWVQDAVKRLAHGFDRRKLELAGILFGALGMLLVGLLDDKHELSPPVKFGGQLIIAFIVAACGTRVTLFVHNALFSYAVTILWILTVVNAFNFMDNMNGLCAGLGAVGAWCFAMFAAAGGQYLVALIAFLTLGALVGFLPHNFPRATSFLGDSGSHLVGYLLAVLAILPHFYTATRPRHWAVLTPLLVLAVPLLDLVWVVLIRWRRGQPFYHGDTNHLSHRLVRRGLTRVQTVLLIWTIAAFFGVLACLG